MVPGRLSMCFGNTTIAKGINKHYAALEDSIFLDAGIYRVLIRRFKNVSLFLIKSLK